MEDINVLINQSRKLRNEENPCSFVVKTPINKNTLDQYIAATTKKLDSLSGAEPVYDTIAYALKYANSIAASLEKTTYYKIELFHLTEYFNVADTGRVYALGLSLQQAPKLVRVACLGPCAEYDLQAASYALMLGMAKYFDPEAKLAYIEDYVKRRKNVRAQIARETDISESKIKGIFTSLGFGAKATDTPYAAVRGSLTQEQYNKLMSNQNFCNIFNQLNLMNKIIVSNVDVNDLVVGDFKFSPIDRLKKKKTTNQMLAWLYQALESYAMKNIRDYLNEHDTEVLYQVHDCIYLSKAMSHENYINISLDLQQICPYLRMDKTAHTPAGHKDTAYDDMVENHRKFIAQQERLASNYTSPSISDVQIPVKRVVTNDATLTEEWEEFVAKMNKNYDQ